MHTATTMYTCTQTHHYKSIHTSKTGRYSRYTYVNLLLSITQPYILGRGRRHSGSAVARDQPPKKVDKRGAQPLLW